MLASVYDAIASLRLVVQDIFFISLQLQTYTRMKAKQFPGFLIILILFPAIASAQGKQANNWYFGQKAGITFQLGSPPVALLDGQLSSPVESGTACMSDQNGNLLFYSDGKTIWNKNHQAMTNGTNMGAQSSQGGMIVQDPGNENRYYFFNFATTGIPSTPYKFQYSIIDLTNGLGEVLPDQKGIFLYLNTTFHLSAILHENMEDVWVVTHGLGTNSFIAFKVTVNGIVNTPEISYAGTSYSGNIGYMKLSSDGKWLGVGNFYQYLTEIYRFDNVTGAVSPYDVVTIPERAWGVEFSPDNTKFYAQGGFYEFYQYDLTSGDPVQIEASAVHLSTELLGSGALQLGPDGKIYVEYGEEYLGVIHNPDKKGLLCNFEFHAVYLEGRTCLGGLPVFMQSYMRNPEFTSSQYCSGTQTQFNIVNINGIDSVFWKFHDPGNAPNDTSTSFSPSYSFSTADTFYVELNAYSGLLHRTIIDTVIIPAFEQKIIEEGNTWSVLAVEYIPGNPYDDTTFHTVTYKIFSDTVINSVTYNTIMSSTEKIPANWEHEGYIREDVNTSVWMRETANGEEYLLYDFCAVVGEELLIGLNQPVPLTVDSITEVELDGIIRLKFWLSYNDYHETWLTGIGSNKGICFSGSANITGGWYWLMCMSDTNAPVYSNPNFASCYLVTNTQNIVSKSIIIFPNPASDNISFSFPASFIITESEVTIFDITGHLIENKKITGHDFQYNVAHLKEGVYYCRIKSPEYFHTEKLVITR
jgi:hypothetical protein